MSNRRKPQSFRIENRDPAPRNNDPHPETRAPEALLKKRTQYPRRFYKTCNDPCPHCHTARRGEFKYSEILEDGRITHRKCVKCKRDYVEYEDLIP